MAGSMPSNPADLRWSLSYDRVSVDRFLAEIEVQRGALQAQIERAVQAREVAEAAAARRHAAGRTDLGEQVVAAWGELDRLEAEHREIVTTIREAAEREATRVLAAAKRWVSKPLKIASMAGRFSMTLVARARSFSVSRGLDRFRAEKVPSARSQPRL